MPIEQVFQFDRNDEGIELIKASLYSKGFALYTQIWNDQPPLSTVILSYWLNLFGESILPARVLTLCFSTILVWSFCQTLRIYVGNLSALIGTVLLIISSNFLRLSVSVMFGLPSLALAMLSIYTLNLYKQKPRQYLIILSGVLLALSFQVKLFTLFILPLVVFELLMHHKSCKERINQSLPASILLWIASVSIIFVLIGLSFNSLNYEQLLQSHFGQNVKAAFTNNNQLGNTLLLLLQDFDYILLSVPGVIAIWQKKEWEKCFPLIWLVVAIVLLANHRPLWYHHYLLLSIPLTWLATYGVRLSFDFFKPGWYYNFKLHHLKKTTLSGSAAVFLIFSILLSPIKIALIRAETQSLIAQGKSETLIVDTMLKYKASTHWVFTDSPMYAFYSGLLVPPEVAVLSRIRVESEDITVGQLLSMLKTYRPEQVLLGKFRGIRDQLSKYVHEHYLETHATHLVTHYILKKNE